MFADLDVNPLFLPPPGKWRVVEFGPGSGVTNIGRLLKVVGDSDNASSALDLMQDAHYPNTRKVFNDMGIVLSSYTPGSANEPQAGSES